VNSRNKGKRGELEFAEVLRSHGLVARRGQQFAGGTDAPDVVCRSLPTVHFEVKRKEAGNPYDWLAQAVRDAGDKLPIVAHRRNDKAWMAILSMDLLIDFLIMGGYVVPVEDDQRTVRPKPEGAGTAAAIQPKLQRHRKPLKVSTNAKGSRAKSPRP
jgi:hypothetical protein